MPPVPPQFPETSQLPGEKGKTEDGDRIIEFSSDRFR
jgi:hypothetical protein